MLTLQNACCEAFAVTRADGRRELQCPWRGRGLVRSGHDDRAALRSEVAMPIDLGVSLQ
jgi:hypothetical protein